MTPAAAVAGAADVGGVSPTMRVCDRANRRPVAWVHSLQGDIEQVVALETIAAEGAADELVGVDAGGGQLSTAVWRILPVSKAGTTSSRRPS